MKIIRLSDTILPDTIFLNLQAGDRFELIHAVSRRLGERDSVTDPSLLARDAIDREEELSTGIDRGIAMPHARTDAVNRLVCAFVKPAEPLDFGSADGRPCDLVFFSAVPRACVDQYLHFTAAVVRKLQKGSVAEDLRAASSPDEVIAALDM